VETLLTPHGYKYGGAREGENVADKLERDSNIIIPPRGAYYRPPGGVNNIKVIPVDYLSKHLPEELKILGLMGVAPEPLRRVG